jgi:hypothetical protein
MSTSTETMYAVVRYYNYRKNQDFKILHIYRDIEKATYKTHQYAIKEYDASEVVNRVDEQHLYVEDVVVEYTAGSGYDSYVFAVIILPDIEEC